MKLNKNLITILAISTLCVGCNKTTKYTYNSHIKIEFTNSKVESKVINPEDVNILETYYTLESKKMHNLQILPSTGDVNLLVIPMLIPGYENIDLNNDEINDNNKVLEDIEKAFFGTENEKYDSVKTFYQKSSYNKLNISGEVTEWFDIGEYTNYTNAAQIDSAQTYDIVRKAVNWAKTVLKLDMSKYDNDKDGYIDGVWCIYSAPNHTNGGPQTDSGNYWAYTSWGNQDDSVETPKTSNPIYNLFGWASYDFMYEGYGLENIDAHTYIHETGHFLGLNDYYSDQMQYNPIGKIDMMDANVIDHNSYSKMLLGWTKPYIVTGNATIDLYSMENENSFIVIPGDSQKIENNSFDPFGEYILIEFYTNDNLNSNDSINKYSNGYQATSSKGARIYHVDNRKFLLDTSDEYNIKCDLYNNETLDDNHKIILPITNNRGRDNYNNYYSLDYNINLYDEIRMIEATNIDTFSTGGIQKEKSLFKTNDTFSMEKYGKNFFINGNTLNNGDTFSYQINFGEVK